MMVIRKGIKITKVVNCLNLKLLNFAQINCKQQNENMTYKLNLYKIIVHKLSLFLMTSLKLVPQAQKQSCVGNKIVHELSYRDKH